MWPSQLNREMSVFTVRTVQKTQSRFDGLGHPIGRDGKRSARVRVVQQADAFREQARRRQCGRPIKGSRMLIPLVCNSCNTRFEVDAQLSGTHCDCPNRECAARILVPTIASEELETAQTDSDATPARIKPAASAVSPVTASRRRIHKRGILLGLLLVAVGVAVVMLRVTTQRFGSGSV